MIADIFAEAKATYTIADAWQMLGLPGTPKPSCKTPWRDDRNPSFAIFDEGRAWKDHGTGEGGDVVAFVMRALDIDHAEARLWFMERLGIDQPEPIQREPEPTPSKEIEWPGELKKGNAETVAAFSERMQLSYAGTHVAIEAGFLRFVRVGSSGAYVVTDPTRRAAEIRRMDGKTFGKSKAYPLKGVEKAWLPGAHYLVGTRADAGVIISEGATDFLTLVDCWTTCQRAESKPPRRWVPMALLGAGCKRLHPELKPWMRGRDVRLVPDGDEAGDKMRDHWGGLLTDLDCTVETVVMPRGKDLSDVVQSGELKPEGLFA